MPSKHPMNFPTWRREYDPELTTLWKHLQTTACATDIRVLDEESIKYSHFVRLVYDNSIIPEIWVAQEIYMEDEPSEEQPDPLSSYAENKRCDLLDYCDWITFYEPHLLHLWEYIQEMSGILPLMFFNAINFGQFCELCYCHSTIPTNQELRELEAGIDETDDENSDFEYDVPLVLLHHI